MSITITITADELNEKMFLEENAIPELQRVIKNPSIKRQSRYNLVTTRDECEMTHEKIKSPDDTKKVLDEIASIIMKYKDTCSV